VSDFAVAPPEIPTSTESTSGSGGYVVPSLSEASGAYNDYVDWVDSDTGTDERIEDAVVTANTGNAIDGFRAYVTNTSTDPFIINDGEGNTLIEWQTDGLATGTWHEVAFGSGAFDVVFDGSASGYINVALAEVELHETALAKHSHKI